MLYFRLLSYLLLAALSFAVGVVFMKKNLPPIPQLNEAYVYFFKLDTNNNLTPREKIANDFGSYPYRVLYKRNYMPTPEPAATEGYREVEADIFQDRRQRPTIYVKPEARTPGYTLITGVVDSQEELHGVLMFDSAGALVHHWPVSQDHTPWASRADNNIFLHDFFVLPDGSLVTALNLGNTLARIDACGRPIWEKEADIHHSATPDGPDHFWSWDGIDDMVRVRLSDGEIVKRVTLQDVLAANPDTDILGILQTNGLFESTWLNNPFHANDVDPLQPEMADAFPSFEAGDLLLSLRSINLVFVMDPDTARIKWWRVGAVRRQHDPDWSPDGRIIVYDNDTHRGYSRIRAIDPETYEIEDLVDGEPYQFANPRMGAQQSRPDGAILIASAAQGRVFEVSPSGEVVFDYINHFDDENVGYVGSGQHVPDDFFDELPRCTQ